MKEPTADYRGFTFFINLEFPSHRIDMKAICYISNFARDLNKHQISELIETVNCNNIRENITGILIIRNKQFFQILEGENRVINQMYKKIRSDKRHSTIIKLLDITIDGRIFSDYNSGKFEVFQKYANLKKLYLYFNWIKEAEYLPADGIIKLTTNFLKQSK
ncbi:BLUF domain-containing protein [Winogradskyella alexanderae]|uniref:BLUF domain-containing protein n=1 Tax=Winogradskyella alexanderae TaxID=2877123 RepID=A0ABS7XQZ1_9FLAO|nr:BLUF domain-containing protein [Winogradskyella alexanderae]MCA0132432.1 BLUF domain-containing protein [Winogradskyella alexanderae]